MNQVFILVACAFVLITGCKSGSEAPAVAAKPAGAAPAHHATSSPTDVRAVFVELKGRTGDDIGIVTFTETGGAVTVVADIEGLAPGRYRLQLHETGDCSAADFSSAGNTFGPGDDGTLDTLDVSTGRGVSSRVRSSEITLRDGARSILGRAVVVHAEDPGTAGRRMACAVIDPEDGHH